MIEEVPETSYLFWLAEQTVFDPHWLTENYKRRLRAAVLLELERRAAAGVDDLHPALVALVQPRAWYGSEQ